MTVKKKHIIFIFPYAVTAWDAERYGFAALHSKSIIVQVLDVSLLVATRARSSQALNDSYIIKISSYAEFEEQIKVTVQHAIYVDCINGINGFQWKGRKLFHILKRYNATYFLIEIGSLPLSSSSEKHNLINKLKKAVNLTRLFNFIKWKLGKWLVNLQANYLQLYQLPDKIFVGNTEMVTYYLNKYQLSQEKIIPIHSFDHDRYLNFLRNNVVSESAGTCVFLDQALTHHSDFSNAVSLRPVTEQNYIPSMNQFFDLVEKVTNLKVIIAASPRANKELLSKLFGNRLVISGKTMELVAGASLVVMHNTTAVSFAVLFNKPILIVKTAEMLKSFGFNNIIDNMANALGLKPICIDQLDEQEKEYLSQYSQWNRNYDSYKFKYVQTKGLAPRTTWEIVADYL